MSGFKVTYATLAADDDELHTAYDAAIGQVAGEFGRRHPSYIGGEA